MHTDTVAEEYSLVETEPPEALAWFGDAIVFALPGGDSHGKIDNLVNALTLESRGRGPSRQTIADVWKDQALYQGFGRGSWKHMLQLVDGDEGSKAALRDFTDMVVSAEVLVQVNP